MRAGSEYLGAAIGIDMAVEAGCAKGAGVSPKIPMPAVNGTQLGLVASHYSVLLLPAGWPHAAGRHEPAGHPADWAGSQGLHGTATQAIAVYMLCIDCI